jgi:hypothetical protein
MWAAQSLYFLVAEKFAFFTYRKQSSRDGDCLQNLCKYCFHEVIYAASQAKNLQYQSVQRVTHLPFSMNLHSAGERCCL